MKKSNRATHPNKRSTRRPAAAADRRQLERKRATRQNPDLWPNWGKVDAEITHRAAAMARTKRQYSRADSDAAADSLIRRLYGRNAIVDRETKAKIRNLLWNTYEGPTGARGYHLSAVAKKGRRKLKSLGFAVKYNPGGRRKNPPDIEAAAELSEQFHGRAAETVKDVQEIEHTRSVLSDLGKLIEMTVWLDEDDAAELKFTGCRLAAAPDGGQLYIMGNQRLDLAALGLDKYLPKDHVTVGTVASIVYATSKAFHNFEPTEYQHEFAEDGGEEPTLQYDVLSQKFYLTGGSYQVRPEGIVN